jgi:tetratricopeptide (TPR) repeat protein
VLIADIRRAEAGSWQDGGMLFVAADLGDWLVALLADAGRRKLVALVLGGEQERALREAATAAVRLTAGELCPEGGVRAEELAMVVSEVFSVTAPDRPPGAQATMLAALRIGVTGQVAVLGDAGLTGTDLSSAEVLGLSVTVLAEKLTGYLVWEIVVRGSRGGPLEPLAAQLNHDLTHLQGQTLEEMVGQLAGDVRMALAHLDAGQPCPPELRHSLPPDAPAFTGRDDELERITGAITEAGGNGGVVAIHAIAGIPGIGKTALAVHAAHLLRDRFPDRQLFLNLHAHTPGRDPLPPETALAALLAATGVDARYLPEDLEGRASLWRDRMAAQRTLLVLDNAAGSSQVAPLLPAGEHCLVLITSRRQLGDLPGAHAGVALTVLPADQAQQMFVRLAPRAAGDAPRAVAELIEVTGYLPLAISLLARVYARHRHWTLADLAAETRASMLTLTAENDSIAAAFDVSYRHLDAGQQQFFRRLGLHLGTTTDVYASAALAGVSLSLAARQLDALEGEGLVTETGHRRYAMHDLIRRYARDLADTDTAADRERARDRLLDYYQHTAALAEARLASQVSPRHADVPVPPAALPALPDSTRAMAWARSERANLIACRDYAAQAAQYHRVIGLTAAIATLLRQDGPWPDAVRWHAEAVQAAQQIGDRPGRASALSNLAIIQWLSDNAAGAARALEEALGIYRDLGDRLGQANVLSNIGHLRQLTDDYAGATVVLVQALSIYRDLDDHLGRAGALTLLGTVRRETGDYPGAARLLEEALSNHRRRGDLIGQAFTLNSLGVVRWQQHDYAGAADALKEALAISGRLGDRLGQANALNNLGAVRRQTGDYAQAAEALDQAQALWRDIGSRRGQAYALVYLGTVRRQAHDWAGAASALEEALAVLGDLNDRSSQATALLYLGGVRRRIGDHPGAASALEAALATFRDTGDKGGEVEALNEAGTLHRLGGDLGQARARHQEALELALTIGSSWDEAHARAGLARWALAAGHADEASAGLREALEIFQRIGAAEACDIEAELNALAGKMDG